MLKSIEQIIRSKLDKHVIRDRDLALLFPGSPARRYALINKALKKGELIRICRGFYTLNKKYLTHPFSQYYLANRIVPNSFITAESALSFHNWIPERIVQTISITAFGRNRTYNTPVGEFVYYKTPVPNHLFYYGVKPIEIDKQSIYIATPLRALMDYVYLHKVKNASTDFLKRSLRIEENHYSKINKSNIAEMGSVYNSLYVRQLLNNLTHETKSE